MNIFWTKYGETDTTKNTFGFWVFDETTGQGQSSVSFAAGDAKIQQNNGSFVNTTNLPSHVADGFCKITLEQAELQCKVVVIKIVDQTSPKTWLDTSITILIGGHTNAWFTS